LITAQEAKEIQLNNYQAVVDSWLMVAELYIKEAAEKGNNSCILFFNSVVKDALVTKIKELGFITEVSKESIDPDTQVSKYKMIIRW
jgi:hypothetical protein